MLLLSERAKQRAEPTRATCVSVYLCDLLEAIEAVPLLPLSLTKHVAKNGSRHGSWIAAVSCLNLFRSVNFKHPNCERRISCEG